MAPAYRVEFAPPALKQLRDLPRKDQGRLAPGSTPWRPTRGVEKLRGAADQYRIRVGDYRIVYAIRDDRLVVLVLRIGHRREIYRRK